MIQALETIGLGKCFGGHWALRDCTLKLPVGRVVGLVGPNGAGKSTLMHLAVGLLAPSAGSISIFGYSPQEQPLAVLSRVGFLSQERPLYPEFTLSDLLTLGRTAHARWDGELARRRLALLDIPLHQQVDRLASGQQAQAALIMELARRPDLLLLDEPVAHLDPLARRAFQQVLMDAVAEDGLTVLLASHLIADLERLCDSLVMLSEARVQLASDSGRLLAMHKLLVGPRERAASIARTHTVLEARHASRQSTLLVRTNGLVLDPAWEVRDVALEDIILAYLARPTTHMPEQEDSGQEVPLYLDYALSSARF
ncbi:MAG: ABC transporter ATP-binding protein [Ktedonobacteraceae bacterium]